MIVIFSNENDLSTIDVAKRLKQMKQDVIIIEPDTAENMLIGIEINFGVNPTKYNTCIKSYLSNNNTSYTMNYSVKVNYNNT